MVREVITWCSPCFAEDVREQATTVVIALDALKPRALDVCERHRKELVEPLRELLSEMGVIVDSSTPAPQSRSSSYSYEHACSFDGCGKSFKSSKSLSTHRRVVHNIDSEGKPRGDESKLKHQCPDPDCDRGFDTPQGLGAHRAKLHGYVSPHNKGKGDAA